MYVRGGLADIEEEKHNQRRIRAAELQMLCGGCKFELYFIQGNTKYLNVYIIVIIN